MSLRTTLDRTRPALLAARPLLSPRGRAIASSAPARRPQRRSVAQQPPRTAGKRPLAMENVFVQALVQAGSCRRHAKQTRARSWWSDVVLSAANHHRSRRKGSSSAHYDGLRGLRTGNPARDADAGAQQDGPDGIPREQLRSLVQLYDPLPDDPLEELRKEEERESRERAKRPREPRIRQNWHEPLKAKDEADQRALEELERLLEMEEPPPETVYEAYRSLSYPRVAYLAWRRIRKLLNVLAVVQYKDQASMLRYLSIIDDMRAAEIPIAVADWSTAVNFAGSFLRRITETEVESALYIWRDMEHDAKVKGNHVTFNILFHLAHKAGKFDLADMVLKEMRVRNLKFDRYFRTDYILYQGLCGDGEGVRRAYQQLVDEGEIVDTTVMNTVLTALISAGEAMAAEHVFARLKNLANVRVNARPQPKGWRSVRDLGRTLNRAAMRYREDPEKRREVQEVTPIAPNTGTYKILIEHHALTSGNIDRVNELLDEMDQVYGLRPTGDFFYRLLRGFERHGGIRYSSWTRQRLEGTWSAFLMMLDQGAPDHYMARPMVDAAICAFARCAGRDKAMLVWEDVQKRWQPDDSDLEAIDVRLRKLFPAYL